MSSSSSAAEVDCNCKPADRSVCEGGPHKLKDLQYCLLHLPDKDEEKSAAFKDALEKKLLGNDFDFSGVWFPNDFFEQFNFTGRVIFRNATFNVPMTFRKTNFTGADFDSATFKAPVTFRDATFSAPVEFSSAIFEQEVSFHTTTFEAKADFSRAEFRGPADFREATFKDVAEPNFWDAKFLAGTNFENAKFKGRTNFDAVIFQGGTNFNYAKFIETVNFRETTFQDRVFFEDTTFAGEAKFFHTSFKDYVRFKGEVFPPESRPDFRDVKSVELISFHSLTLRPHWFVDLDANKFALTNVTLDWQGITIDQEIGAIEENHKGVSPYLLLETACRNLAVNAEENHRYEDASSFRYMAMETRRQRMWTESKLWKSFWREFNWKSVWRSFSWRSCKSFWGSFGLLHWLYWLGSGYGERVWQAALVLVGLLVLFASLFLVGQIDDQWWKPPEAPAAQAKASQEETSRLRGFGEALIYSAGVMTLQKPEPLPASRLAKTLILLETVLGPAQAALLALAIRRKFMR